MKLSRKALPILLTLNKLNTYFHKLYCYPSQNKLLQLLSSFTSLQISRRQLNYDLQVLESHGLIRRIQRHRVTLAKGMEFRSTLYEITLLGYNLLLRAQVITFNAFKTIRNRIRQALTLQEERKPTPNRTSQLTSLSDIIHGLPLPNN